MNALGQTVNNLGRLGRRISQVYANRFLEAENAYLSRGLRTPATSP